MGSATRGRSATLLIGLLPCPGIIDLTSGLATGSATRGQPAATFFIEPLSCPSVIDFASGFASGSATRGQVATFFVGPLPCPEVCVATDDCWEQLLTRLEPVIRLNCGAFIPLSIELAATCGHFRINV